MDNSEQLRMTVYASLLAALTAAGAYLIIPIGPVPISLQTLFVYLTGLLLGSRWGTASVAVYLLAGACGLPVFAGGTGGLGRLFGPTGGYLMGYLPAVFVVGWLVEKTKKSVGLDVAAAVCGALIVYALGVPWLKLVTGMGWSKAFGLGMAPFLAGDAVKIAALVPVARVLRPILAKKQDR